jgi:ATP-dependent Clp protease ATP-binding subunit ClpC
VAEQGFDPQYGARPLKRAIQRYLEDPLSEAIIRMESSDSRNLRVELNEEGNDTVVAGEMVSANILLTS